MTTWGSRFVCATRVGDLREETCLHHGYFPLPTRLASEVPVPVTPLIFVNSVLKVNDPVGDGGLQYVQPRNPVVDSKLDRVPPMLPGGGVRDLGHPRPERRVRVRRRPKLLKPADEKRRKLIVESPI